MPLTLLIVDDHDMIRLGIKTMLSGSDFQIVADAADGKQAVILAAKHKPDVALVDVCLPKEDQNGIWVLQQLRKKSPKTAVVMMSAYDNPSYLAQSMEHGAVDFLPKDAARHDIIYTIHRAATGIGEPSCRKTRNVRILMSKRRNRNDSSPLTNREMDVIRLIAEGLSNREIGEKLDISIETVKEHVQHLLRRLQLESRTQAALWAFQNGIVE